MFLSKEKLDCFGFKSIGENVLVSDKASIYNPEEIEIGDNSRIDDFCVISGKVKLGKNVHIAALCLVAGGTLGIEFCDFSAIAYSSCIFTQNDDYDGFALHNPTVPVQYRLETKASIKVGECSLIGSKCVVGPGANIGENCSVGANSLVLSPLKSNYVYWGSPAKDRRKRRLDIYTEKNKYRLRKLNKGGS